MLSRSKFGTGLPTFCDGEGNESLRNTFGQGSPLLRPYITDSSPFQYLFNTSESRIVDEKVIERCSGGNETPKLVRIRYESDQEGGGYEAPELTPTVYQLRSAQVLPWFCFCSTVLRSARDRSAMRPRSLSENYRSAIGGSSEKGRTRSGLGRYQVGTLSTYLSSFARYFIASEATDRQTIGKEKANKYQAKPKPSPGKEQRISRGSERSGDGLSNRLLLSLGRYSRRIGLCPEFISGTQRSDEMVLGIKKLPERYRKGTGEVLNSGAKGTGEILESYQRGTKKLQAASRSVVGYDRDGGESQVASSTDDTSITVDDLGMNRLILSSFCVLCEGFRVEVESLTVKGNKGRQIALKELIDFEVKSKRFAYSLLRS